MIYEQLHWKTANNVWQEAVGWIRYLVHGVHSERVRPETVVHRHKGKAGAARGQKHSHQGGRHAEESQNRKWREAPVAVERREHHVRGVQRVDEVWREGVLLFHRVGSPAEEEQWDCVSASATGCSVTALLKLIVFGDIKRREDLRQSDNVKVWSVFDDITGDISLIYSDLIPCRHRVKHQKNQGATGGCFLNVSGVKVVVLVVEAAAVRRVLWLSFQIQFNDDWCKTWTITDDI